MKLRNADGRDLAASQVLRYLFELAAVAGVDDGVQAAVEVSEPEDDFEEGLRRPEAAAERA